MAYIGLLLLFLKWLAMKLVWGVRRVLIARGFDFSKKEVECEGYSLQVNG